MGMFTFKSPAILIFSAVFVVGIAELADPAKRSAGPSHRRQLSKQYNATEVPLTKKIVCIPNPPSEGICRPTLGIVKLMKRYMKGGPPFNIGNLPKNKKGLFWEKLSESPCVGPGREFMPLHRTHGYDYYICTYQFRIKERNDDPWKINFLMTDSQDNLADGDILPWLMKFASDGPGVALDIGATQGATSFPLLSRGHRVHLFEDHFVHGSLARHERDFVDMTLQANGWESQVSFHGYVSPTTNMAGMFSDEDKIHLVKIDVDHNKSYEEVFVAIAPVFNKTEIIQIEMITHETSVANKEHVLQRFDKFGFDMYGIEDVDTYEGYYQSNLMAKDESRDDLPEGKMHRDAVDTGEEDYVYGESGPMNPRLFPICNCRGLKCGTSTYPHFGLSRASRFPLEHGLQFAFVRRDSKAMHHISALYGSCSNTCQGMDRIKQEQDCVKRRAILARELEETIDAIEDLGRRLEVGTNEPAETELAELHSQAFQLLKESASKPVQEVSDALYKYTEVLDSIRAGEFEPHSSHDDSEL